MNHCYMTDDLSPDALWQFQNTAKRNAAWFGTSTTIHKHPINSLCSRQCETFRPSENMIPSVNAR